ncbi:MAG: hypothetical protein IJ685_00830 [Selenomonadaceae bacterium]|nr:hypothetical protein [Selenomonadaceae bacterium]
MDDKMLDWMTLAEKFSSSGDPRSMRAVAREIFEVDKNSAEGLAIMAESALYLGNVDEAENLSQYSLSVDANNLRGRLVLGGVAVKKLKLKAQIKIFEAVIDDAHKRLKQLTAKFNEYTRKLSAERRPKTDEDVEFQKRLDKEFFLTNAILFKALCWISNGLYLAGEPHRAADVLLEASTLTDQIDRAAELYSKHLFLRNYREMSIKQAKEIAQKFDTFFAKVPPFPHNQKSHDPDKKIHIGYISPDFREHAVANFLPPLFENYDAENFSVTCYSTGRKDSVTEKIKRNKIGWRELIGKDALTAAKIIDEDNVDILVDLSGHSQDSCLPILAHKPAPVQICGIGYTATTGLGTIDYFLSDKVCSPETLPSAFIEKILRVDSCNLCYSPGLIRDIPEPELRAPILKNDFITYGCFNNFAKVSEEILYVWRAILDRVPKSRLVLKNKICSLEDGCEIVREKLTKMSFPLDRVELRPYSADYLEQYREIDVALDTFPYTGGTTTCEALYMGVPVVTLRGKTHGSRLSASILTAADMAELIAHSPMDYIKKAAQLARRKELVAAYHVGLREHMQKSALMNSENYIRNLEKIYRKVWQDYCHSINQRNFNPTFNF